MQIQSEGRSCTNAKSAQEVQHTEKYSIANKVPKHQFFQADVQEIRRRMGFQFHQRVVACVNNFSLKTAFSFCRKLSKFKVLF